MVELSPDERAQIIGILRQLPEFADESSRRALVQAAGLASLATQLDLSGSPFVAASLLVGHLIGYGRVSVEHEALGRLLNLVKALTGLENQAVIDALLTGHAMMVPTAKAPQLPDPGAPLGDSAVLEKIIGENTLLPLAFLAQGLRTAASVAFLDVRQADARWSGTGFLVAPDVLLTNHHVIGDAAAARGVTVRFGYEDDVDGTALPTAEFRPSAAGLLFTDETLDFSLIEIDARPGDAWGWLALRPLPVRVGQRISVIQHPGGQAKQVTLHHNQVVYQGGGVMQYLTSTLPGSSGSPVLDGQWRVVALHHAGGNLREPTTGRVFYRNEGILVSSILEALPPALRERVTRPGPAGTGPLWRGTAQEPTI